MYHPFPARREAQPSGVIETLSAGYAAVNRQLWVLLLPVLLDVFLWLGPHVSFAPLVGPLVVDASEWTRQVALSPAPGPGPRRATSTNPDLLPALAESRQWLIAATDDVNGLDALAWGPIGVPTPPDLPSASQETAFVTGWPDGLALLVASLGLGLVLGGWFYRGLAAASTGARGGPLEAGRTTLGGVAGVLGLAAVIVGAAVLLGLPIVLLIAFTALVSPPVAVLGSVLLAAGILFAGVHLFFAVSAIFVSNAGPLAAIQRSVGLVRRHLWPSVGLIVLTWLILAGMGRVWDALASSLQSPYGVAAGILGNAYVASGLIAAGMIFYTQRSEPVSASGAVVSS